MRDNTNEKIDFTIETLRFSPEFYISRDTIYVYIILKVFKFQNNRNVETLPKETSSLR